MSDSMLTDILKMMNVPESPSFKNRDRKIEALLHNLFQSTEETQKDMLDRIEKNAIFAKKLSTLSNSVLVGILKMMNIPESPSIKHRDRKIEALLLDLFQSTQETQTLVQNTIQNSLLFMQTLDELTDKQIQELLKHLKIPLTGIMKNKNRRRPLLHQHFHDLPAEQQEMLESAQKLLPSESTLKRKAPTEFFNAGKTRKMNVSQDDHRDSPQFETDFDDEKCSGCRDKIQGHICTDNHCPPERADLQQTVPPFTPTPTSKTSSQLVPNLMDNRIADCRRILETIETNISGNNKELFENFITEILDTVEDISKLTTFALTPEEATVLSQYLRDIVELFTKLETIVNTSTHVKINLDIRRAVDESKLLYDNFFQDISNTLSTLITIEEARSSGSEATNTSIDEQAVREQRGEAVLHVRQEQQHCEVPEHCSSEDSLPDPGYTSVVRSPVDKQGQSVKRGGTVGSRQSRRPASRGCGRGHHQMRRSSSTIQQLSADRVDQHESAQDSLQDPFMLPDDVSARDQSVTRGRSRQRRPMGRQANRRRGQYETRRTSNRLQQQDLSPDRVIQEQTSQESLPDPGYTPIVRRSPGQKRQTVQRGRRGRARRARTRARQQTDRSPTTVQPEIQDAQQNLNSNSEQQSLQRQPTGPTENVPEIRRWKNSFYPSDPQIAEQNRNFEALKVYRQEVRERQNAGTKSREDMPPNPILMAGHLMHEELDKLKWEYCSHCNEQWFDMDISRNVKKCRNCKNDRSQKKTIVQPDGSSVVIQLPPKFSAGNDMHARDAPQELTCLNPVEQVCVSRLFIRMTCYKIRGFAQFLKGHVITFPQDVSEFISRLPPLPEDLPIIVVTAPGQPVPLQANRNKILTAIRWLKANNPWYADVEIDMDALNHYPDNDTDFLTGLQVIEDPSMKPDEADNPTVYTSVEHTLDLTYSLALNEVNRDTVSETIRSEILGKSNNTKGPVNATDTPAEPIGTGLLPPDPPEVLWPARGSQPVSEWQEGYMSMAFPWLPGFCYGECDITTPRIGQQPSLYQWVIHLLKHPSRAFAQDPRFLLAMCNRYLRSKALTTGNVFAKNNARDITMAQLKERLADNDDAVIRSLLNFSRTIPGSRQFWKWKTSEAHSLVNWVHLTSDGQDTFNLFLTVSFADNHIRELHNLLDTDRTYIDKIVIKNMRDVPAGANPADYIDKATDYRLRAEAVSKNGDVASYFFDKKLKLLIDEVLKKCLGVEDFIIRCEFQYRSTEHFHMVLRVRDGLSLDTVEDAFTQHYFDLVKSPEYLSEKNLQEQQRVQPMRDQVVDFVVNRLGISTVHPEPDPALWPAPEGRNPSAPPVNCLRQTYDDAVEPTASLDDYINLVNRLEMHKCKANYCRKLNELKKTLEECRLGYPQKLVGYTLTRDDADQLIAVLRDLDIFPQGCGFGEKGVFKQVRNHPRLVGHIPEILQVWRANTDAQIVKSCAQLLEYVLKYILKPEVSSEAFSNKIKGLLDNFTEESPVRKLFGRVLMKTLNEHDYSRTEAFRLFSPQPFVMMSRPIKTVNVLGTRIVDTTDTNDDRRAVKPNIADKYWTRQENEAYQALVIDYEAGKVDYPRHPHDVSLYQFVSHFTENWQLTGNLYVPHCTPNFYYPPKPKNKKYRQQYCRTMLLLHKPATTPDSLSDDVENELADFVETQLCPVLLRKEYLNSLEESDSDAPVNENEELLPSPLDRQPGVIEQDPFMLATGGEVAQDTINTDVAVDETEVDHEADGDYDNLITAVGVNWDEDRCRLNFTNADIKSNEDWITRKTCETSIPVEWNAEYSRDSLNEGQRRVFDAFQPMIEAAAENKEKPDGRHIDVSGFGGTGKSVLIKTIMQQAEETTGKTDTVKVMAYTNSAVKDFPGAQTIHKTFHIDVDRDSTGTQTKKPVPALGGQKLKQIQEELDNTVALIFDEKSMIGTWMLSAVDIRCREAKPAHSQKEFGNLTVLLAGKTLVFITRHIIPTFCTGDHSQLPPVFDHSLCLVKCKAGPEQQRGRLLYQGFDENYVLTESMRQAGESNTVFRGLLNRLATGQTTPEDWKVFCERSLCRLDSATQDLFMTTATKLCARKVDSVQFNQLGLQRTGNPILVVKSVNSKGATRFVSDKAGGLVNTLPIAKDCKIVLTANLWPQAGLVNGSRGTVRYIVFPEDKSPPENTLPAFVVCHFPDYKGPAFIENESCSVPIFPVTREWLDKGKKYTRVMLPLLLGYSLTIHKSQGNMSRSLYYIYIYIYIYI